MRHPQARKLLNIPAPKVYSWNSDARGGSVGAEYIIMEKMPGIKLATVWDTMHSKKKLEIILQLVQYEKGFATSKFPAYGGLYYAKDVAEGRIPTMYRGEDKSAESTLVIGPTNNRKYFDDGRSSISLDRGPCKFLCISILADSS